ncbi:MAG: ABC transporter substrate-binding protein [Gammaproteobacteria bacterium]|nr:ABC transporter substrate-binding protein [Gammaproteobacteria bacterium]
MKKPFLAATAVLLFAATAAQAQPYGARAYHPGYAPQGAPMARPAQAPSEVETPEQILRQGLDRMQGFLSQGSLDPQELLAFLDNEIAPYFDFPLMSRWVLGRGYDQMSEGQKSEFTQRLKGMFFSALAKNLKALSNPPPRIDIFGSRVRRDARQVAVGALVRGSMYEQPVRLQFRFYRGNSGWKVFDVTANGISAVSYYRQQFNQMRQPYYR